MLGLAINPFCAAKKKGRKDGRKKKRRRKKEESEGEGERVGEVGRDEKESKEGNEENICLKSGIKKRNPLRDTVPRGLSR